MKRDRLSNTKQFAKKTQQDKSKKELALEISKSKKNSLNNTLEEESQTFLNEAQNKAETTIKVSLKNAAGKTWNSTKDNNGDSQTKTSPFDIYSKLPNWLVVFLRCGAPDPKILKQEAEQLG